ncbi:translocation/assembly module TamB domain-containing protein [Saccharicrinis fermentans]|nr:translocation/assembly module TamB domain-containing protein [Saccharicrinis fermentans]
MMKRVVQISSFVLGSIIGLLLLLILLIRLGYVNSMLVRLLSYEAGKYMQGELHIESLQGNIFSDFVLHHIKIVQGEDTLITCREVYVHYRIWSLLNNKIEVNELKIDRLHMNLKQDQEAGLNLVQLMSVPSEEDSSMEKPAMDLEIRSLCLDQFSSSIYMFEKNHLVPSYIESSMQAALWLSGDQVDAVLQSFNMTTQEPSLHVYDLSGRVRSSLNKISWEGVRLQLDNSLATTQGSLELNSKGTMEAGIRMDPLDFSDITGLMPDLKLYGQPRISFAFWGDSSKYKMKANMRHAKQSIQVKGELTGIYAVPKYTSQLVVDGLDVGYWTRDSSLNSHVSGYLQLKGVGLDVRQNEMELEGRFEELVYGNYNFQQLNIKSTKYKGDLKGQLMMLASFGNVDLNYRLGDVFGQPKYYVKAQYHHLNLQHIPGIDAIYTSLNGDISVSGSGLALDSLMADVIVHSNNSKFLDYPIDDFKIQAEYRRGYYRFTGLNFETPYFSLSAQGNGHWSKNNHINFGFEARDISPLLTEFKLPGIDFKGAMEGLVEGKIDDLKAQVSMVLHHAKYDTLQVGASNGHLRVNRDGKEYQGELTLKSTNLNYLQYKLDTIDLKADFSDEQINTQLNLSVNDSLTASFQGLLENYENPLLWIKQLSFDYKGSKWNSKQDSTYIVFDPKDIEVHQFNLMSGTQSIGVDGVFSFEGTNDLTINMKDIDLRQIPLQDFLSQQISGRMSSLTFLIGTALKPIIKNHLSLEEFYINHYAVDHMTSHLIYEDELLTHQGVVSNKTGSPMHFSLNIPMHLSFNDSIYLLKDSPLFLASLVLDSLDLNALHQIYPLEEIEMQGYLSTRINASNTINDPLINGHLLLSNGLLENDVFGVYYKDIGMDATINQNLITLNSMAVRTNKKGTLDMNGFIKLGKKLYEDSSSVHIELMANNFQALKSDRVDMNINGNMKMSGSTVYPLLTGLITVNRSRINADYFNHFFSQKSDDPNPPLLMTAMEGVEDSLDLSDSILVDPLVSSSLMFKNLRGKVEFKIPSNTWVRGKTMNFELNGSLQFIKSSEDVDIVGNIKVKKGSYKMYGRNFNIKEGELIFTGGKELNPYVDFIVLHKFRDVEKELRTLQIHITGRMLQPEMEFVLDDEAIDEKDAIAYIVFKKSADHLSAGQKKTVFGGEEWAMGIVLDQLSFVVKESLKQTTGLDVIEISGEDNWKTSNVTLGKYITNKLYLSYEQAFILDKKTKAVNTEKMMLEYEFIRNIVLKATNQNSNSGFDLIFKQKWK